MFGEHPVLAPAVVAFILGVFAIVAVDRGEWVTAILAYIDALGMVAIAAHSRLEQKDHWK
jgi:hypothetical protein